MHLDNRVQKVRKSFREKFRVEWLCNESLLGTLERALSCRTKTDAWKIGKREPSERLRNLGFFGVCLGIRGLCFRLSAHVTSQAR